MLKHIYFCLWLVAFSCIYGQQPAAIHLTEKDGLPDIEFYNIIEDTQQFIWLAADKGLYRYDGKNYKYFTHPEQKGNAVFGTLEDNKGRVWCNNISGQFFFTENNELKLFVDLGDILTGELTEFIVTQEELIVLPGTSIIRVNLKTKEVKKDFDASVFIGAMEKTPKGYLFTKGNVLINADKSLKTIDSLEIDVFDNYSIDSGVANRVIVSSKDKINLCHFLKSGKNEFYTFNFSKSTYNSVKIPVELEKRIITHTFFYENQLWFSTDLGVYVCELIGDKLVLQNYLFKKKFITKIIKDSDSNYWVTTKGDGIYVIPNINIHQYQDPKELYSIAELEKINDSLLIYGTKDGKIGAFNTNTSKYRIINETSAYNVTEIVNIPEIHTAIVTKEDVAFRINTKTLAINAIKNAPEIIGAKSISVIRDTSYVFSKYKNAVKISRDFQLDNILIKKRSYINHYSGLNNSIYIGTVDGLFVFDEFYNKTEITYKNKAVLAKHIAETSYGDIWVSTFNDGVFHIKNGKINANYTTQNGLLSTRISYIKEDINNLWIATDEGIQYLDTATKTFKNLTKQNGVPSYRISDIELKNNTVYFATNTGIFSVQKNKAFKNLTLPKVYISDISIGLKSVPLKKSYDLAYNKNSIKINFNANGFQSAINNTYQFRLIGQNDVWQTDDSKSNTISFYSLPAGSYTFQLKSILTNANDSDSITTVNFEINKPFWEQWWFYTITILFIGIVVYAIFKRKIKILKKQQSEVLQKELINKQLIFSQLENLRSQMNPHFIFNALNSIQEYIVLNEKELASSFLIKFSRLIRIYLEHSRENEVTLKQELKALDIYLELEKNRFEDVLEYSLTVSNHIDTNKIKVPSLFIQPYVENALKHGLLHKKENRVLNIDFSVNTTENELNCHIKDNGVGVEVSKQINATRYPNHKSFATSANAKRVHLLNLNRKRKIRVATQSLKTETSNGTFVIITIPLKDIK